MITRGIVRSVNGDEIATDGIVNPGNGGGPLFNYRETVVNSRRFF